MKSLKSSLFNYSFALAALTLVLGLGTSVYAGVWTDYTPYTVGSASSTNPFVTVTSTGRVGIGTTTPTSLLTLQGNEPTVTLRKSISSQAWQMRVGMDIFSSSLVFHNLTNNRPSLTIGTDGNVAIGTTSTPTNSRLYVVGGATGANIDVRGDSSIVGGDQATIELEGADYDSNPNSALLQYYGSQALGTTMGFDNDRLGVLSFSGANVGIIRTAGNSPTPLVFGTDDTERLRITGDGRVGIGTDAPASPLHVSAGANATTTVSFAELNDTSSKTCVNVNNSGGNPASFYVDATGALVVENGYCK